jgi:hypothetical protein
MFTFVVWAIGLAILAGMASVNLAVIVAAFESHWAAGWLVTTASAFLWLALVVWALL